MTKDWKYIAYLCLLGLLLATVYLSKTKQHDWSITYSHLSKEPYGTFAFNELIPEYFRNSKITNSYKTLYELKDSIQPGENILVISSQFAPDDEDANVLLNLVEAGANAFISANYFYGKFADTLGLATGDSFFQGDHAFNRNDSAQLHFVSPVMDSLRTFQYKRGNMYTFFRKIDSANALVIAKNDFNEPITVRIKKGKGSVILNCTPMVFTNINLLSTDNYEFVSTSLSYLPENSIYRSEFYHIGRMESATPLRFILNNEPLRWAYFITIFSILIFMVFEAKRKQRIIPIQKPLSNTTLEFVSTIGNLYYQHGDHKNIAEKKIQFFFDFIHANYFMTTDHRDEAFCAALARKSGVQEKEIKSLIGLIHAILSRPIIQQSELISLNKLLETFYKKN
jgi:hypothetical protein